MIAIPRPAITISVNAVVGGSEVYVTTGKELLTFNLMNVKEAFRRELSISVQGLFLIRPEDSCIH